MTHLISDPGSQLCSKIARLVEERGWNLEEFARNAKLNRLTVRQIILDGKRRLRNATVSACAQALGLSVNELRMQPLERLLERMRPLGAPGNPDTLRRLYERATQPELVAWIERNPDAAAKLTDDEMDELLSLQGTGGPLTRFGLQHFLHLLERRRQLRFKMEAVAGTEYLDLLEKLVDLLYDRIQPYRDRGVGPAGTQPDEADVLKGVPFAAPTRDNLE
jgi:transcriptional regulator with XRE-family HTH domain